MSITSIAPRKLDLSQKTTDPTVGPGSYELPGSIHRPTQSSIPFGVTAKREWKDPAPCPGPTDYCPPGPNRRPLCDGSTMASVVPRVTFPKGEPGPAPCEHAQPGKWSPKKPGTRCPMSSRTPRSVFSSAVHPCSPADLDVSTSLAKNASAFGRELRFNQSGNGVPGPGTYQFASGLKEPEASPSPAFLSQVSRTLFRSSDTLVDRAGLAQQSWSGPARAAPFGSRARGGRRIWALSKNPGPGSYEVATSLNLNGAQKAPFGQGSGDRSPYGISQFPGPGQYDARSGKRAQQGRLVDGFLQRSPRFIPQRQNNDCTSVGQYNVNADREANRARLLGASSSVFKSPDERDPYAVPKIKVPGPGAYNPDESQRAVESHKLLRCIDGTTRDGGPGVYVGMKLTDTPGPGRYDPPDTLGTGGVHVRNCPRFSFTISDNPAPGTYNIAGSLVKPSANVRFAMGCDDM